MLSHLRLHGTRWPTLRPLLLCNNRTHESCPNTFIKSGDGFGWVVQRQRDRADSKFRNECGWNYQSKGILFFAGSGYINQSTTMVLCVSHKYKQCSRVIKWHFSIYSRSLFHYIWLSFLSLIIKYRHQHPQSVREERENEATAEPDFSDISFMKSRPKLNTLQVWQTTHSYPCPGQLPVGQFGGSHTDFS